MLEEGKVGNEGRLDFLCWMRAERVGRVERVERIERAAADVLAEV
jgi:hypothetical protein